MIYLKPLGGLCNRIRTVDSMLTLCKENKEDLTILWVNNPALNSNYDELFLIPEISGFKLTIVNCPPGFPDLYFPKAINSIKNIVKGRRLSAEYKPLLKKIVQAKAKNSINNHYLMDLYEAPKYVDKLSAGELDEMIYPKLASDLKKFFNNNTTSGYIDSCHRLCPIENDYKLFVPAEDIQKRIQNTVNRFNNTIGLHIRKSDHVTSRKYSTTEKFVSIVDKEIERDPKVSFFVSTDDEETKQHLISNYGDKIIYNEISSYDRNDPLAVKDAVVDLYCLAATSKLFGSHHSSFSQVAAIIGGIEEITAR
ncbi:hypothetical protein [Muriicola sp. Z0-33]|uniref:hypothetical protein n=1 Tax=Muriicola sp. Z0-33 TaxID=2816957 RepID=UPI0022386C40|nr:hypothetical protein [Muriicola sp. Z0-33]MCW5515596.1 hypothetical protein [Muriicola sp. Z0-33]